MSQITVFGQPAVLPLVTVVNIATGGAPVTARETARFITHTKPTPQIFRYLVTGATHGEHTTRLRVSEQPGETRCTPGETPGRVSIDRSIPFQAARLLTTAKECQDRNSDLHLRANTQALAGGCDRVDQQASEHVSPQLGQVRGSRGFCRLTAMSLTRL